MQLRGHRSGFSVAICAILKGRRLAVDAERFMTAAIRTVLVFADDHRPSVTHTSLKACATVMVAECRRLMVVNRRLMVGRCWACRGAGRICVRLSGCSP